MVVYSCEREQANRTCSKDTSVYATRKLELILNSKGFSRGSGSRCLHLLTSLTVKVITPLFFSQDRCLSDAPSIKSDWIFPFKRTTLKVSMLKNGCRQTVCFIDHRLNKRSLSFFEFICKRNYYLCSHFCRTWFQINTWNKTWPTLQS